MKKYLIIIAFWLLPFSIFAQQIIFTSDFENTTASNPPSGWDFNGVDTDAFSTFLARSGTKRLGLNANGEFFRTSQYFCPGSIEFYWRSSGATGVYKVDLQYSQDNTTWTTFQTIQATGSGAPITYQAITASVPTANLVAPFKYYIRFFMTERTSGTFYVDDMTIKKGTCTVVPTQLRFINTPNNCISRNTNFQLTVCATDNNGFIDSTYNQAVTVNLVSGAGTLTGNTGTASNGCAILNGIKFDGVAPLSLSATSGSLVSNQNVTTLDIQTKCPNVDTLKIVTYNVLNFPGGASFIPITCGTPEVYQNRVDTLGKILSYIKPHVLIVQELQTLQGANDILSRGLNINGVTKYAMAPYIENQSTIVKSYNNECYYDANKLTLKRTRIIKTGTRDCTYYVFYGKDPGLATTQDTTWLDVLSFHTKARGFIDPTGDNLRKTSDCQAVIDSVRKWHPGPRNIVIGGDLNFYSSTDGGFLALTTDPNNTNVKFIDPVNRPGEWEGNAMFKDLHTQAARCSDCPQLECGAKGGLDSRLDFWLATDPIMDGSKRIEYIPNTYKATGNDGNSLNISINGFSPTGGNNSSEGNVTARKSGIIHQNTSGVPQSVLTSMYNMSDHIPVEMKLKITYPELNTQLSIKDIKLNARWANEKIALSWNTQNESSLALLILEMANENTKGFIQILKVSETKQIINYEYIPKEYGNMKFRLRLIDQQGNTTYSNVKEMIFDGLTNITVAPNPVINVLKIKVFHKKYEQNQAVIMDNTGKKISQFELNGSGYFDKELDVSKFPTGIYFVQVSNNNRNVLKKFIKK